MSYPRRSVEVTNPMTAAQVAVGPRTQTPMEGNAMQVQIGPGDTISAVPVVILFEHHQVHEGEAHRAQNKQASLGTGTVKYGVTVPADTFPHMVFEVDTYDGAVEVNIYAEATFTGGSAVTAQNRNRNKTSTVPNTTIKSGVTSTDGTLIHSFYVGAGQKIAQVARAASELILKAGVGAVPAIYRVDVIGLSSGTRAIVGFEWYEDLGV